MKAFKCKPSAGGKRYTGNYTNGTWTLLLPLSSFNETYIIPREAKQLLATKMKPCCR